MRWAEQLNQRGTDTHLHFRWIGEPIFCSADCSELQKCMKARDVRLSGSVQLELSAMGSRVGAKSSEHGR